VGIGGVRLAIKHSVDVLVSQIGMFYAYGMATEVLLPSAICPPELVFKEHRVRRSPDQEKRMFPACHPSVI